MADRRGATTRRSAAASRTAQPVGAPSQPRPAGVDTMDWPALRDAVAAAKRSGDWSSIRGNFGPPGEKIDVSHLRAHATLEALLADNEVDLVDICSPPHAHAAAIEASLAAGKHVLCEKPLALDAESAQKLARAAVAAQLQNC